MSNGNGVHQFAERAAESAVLATIARLFAVISPMIIFPLMIWLFSTVSETQLAAVKQGVRVDVIDQRLSNNEASIKDINSYLRTASEERRKDWIDIRERITRVETQNTNVLDELKRLNAQLEKAGRK